MAKDLEAVAGTIGALEDELRRRKYLFIRQQDHPVTREEAARHVGISRKLAAFHLDKVVEKGLLTVQFGRARERRPGRRRSELQTLRTIQVTVDDLTPRTALRIHGQDTY